MSTRGYAAAAVAALSVCLTGCAGGGSQSPATVTVTATAPRASAAGATSPATTAKPPSPEAPSTTAAPKPFALGVGSFGGLKLPATPEAVLAAAKPLLGNPTKHTTGPGCELGGPGWTSVALQWGDVLAYGEAGPGQKVKIDSWILRGKATPSPVTLPYGTSMGMSRTALAKALTNEDVDTEHMFAAGDIYMQDSIWWSLDKANTTVVQITYNPHLCE